MFYNKNVRQEGFRTSKAEAKKMYREKIMEMLQTIEDENLLKRIYNFIYNLLFG